MYSSNTEKINFDDINKYLTHSSKVNAEILKNSKAALEDSIAIAKAFGCYYQEPKRGQIILFNKPTANNYIRKKGECKIIPLGF